MASTGSRAFTAGSEFHRAPPARGGYVVRVLHTDPALTQSPRSVSQAAATVVGHVRPVVGLGHGLHFRGHGHELTGIDGFAADRLRYANREGDKRGLLCLTA